MGHFGEIFTHSSDVPAISEEEVANAKRLLGPLCLDSYLSFDRKTLGDWRIIGHQSDYHPEDVEDAYFAYGLAGSCKRIDIFGNIVRITEVESRNYPRYTSYSDPPIQMMLDELEFPGKPSVSKAKA